MEQQDGFRRLFLIDWQRVAQDNPAYGKFGEGEIAKKGLEHPSIMTEFRLIEIDAGAAFSRNGDVRSCAGNIRGRTLRSRGRSTRR